MRSIFVTGTDTEVGKTRISVGIIHKLVAQGYKVAAMKPIASGCEVTVDGLRNEDALALMAASNVDLPYELVNPYAFKPAIAPHIAAQQVGVDIDFEIIQKNYDLIQQQADLVVVEGAGGWLVPLNNTTTMADLAKQLKLDVVLVVGIRLGCINHALLTATAIQQSGLEFKGWVANDLESSLQLNEMLATLKQHIQEPNMGMVPQLSPLDVSTDYIFVV
jgi:dethiobiotin synthetase